MDDYERAMNEFRRASAAYRAACLAFRKRLIDDVEFLAAKRRMDYAQIVADDAERAVTNGGA